MGQTTVVSFCYVGIIVYICLTISCVQNQREVNEVYQYELQDIPLSKELLEQLGFRFDKVDYKIKGWECYRLTKVEKVYLSPSFFVEEEMYTPLIGYAITADGEERFSIFTRKYIDNRIGTCRVKNLNEFLYLCERLGCYVKADIEKLECVYAGAESRINV